VLSKEQLFSKSQNKSLKQSQGASILKKGRAPF
jgi:hypothetical protein